MNETPPASTEPRRRAIIARIAMLAAPALLATALAVRPICSLDFGYHLAYGDHFLNTGQIVQTNRFIYTHIDKRILAHPGQLGPGCWYDADTDTYHFVNANWLSQVIMAGVYRAGGMNGLVVCQVVLVLAIVAVIALAMARGGVGWPWASAAATLAVLGAYTRFNLRPELFGYLVLAGQWSLLMRRDFGWRSAAGVIALQVLAVNLHSYFLLGPALAAAMLVGAAARWLWARRSAAPPAPPRAAAQLKWLAIAAGGAVLACLANPWLLRGAIMPVQTLLFLRTHDVLARAPGQAAVLHPWATIAELVSPMSKAFFRTMAGRAYLAALGLGGVAAIVGLLRRRWGAVLILIGMAAVSTSLQRNTAVAGMVIFPLSFIILADGWRWLSQKLRWGLLGGLGRWVGRIAAAATAVAAILLAWRVVTQQFYLDERLPWRFGGGASRLMLPIDAAGWINDASKPRPLPGRIFCDYDTTSSLLHLTGGKYEMPALTNTWAVPPYVLGWVIQCTSGQRPFGRAIELFDVNTVVLRSSMPNGPLMKALAADSDWAVVHLSPGYVVLLRVGGPAGELARQHRIDPGTLDVAGYAAEVAQCDPKQAYAIDRAAMGLYRLAWGDKKMAGGNVSEPDETLLTHEIAWAEKAAALWRQALQRDPHYRQATLRLSTCLGLLGSAKALRMASFLQKNQPILAQMSRRFGLPDGDQLRRVCEQIPQYRENLKRAEHFRLAALESWSQAERLLTDALRRDEHYRPFHQHRQAIRSQRDAFQRGIIQVPPIPLQ